MPNGEAPLPRQRRFKRLSERRTGAPHGSGYAEQEADPDPGAWETAVTPDGRPSLLRCVWRGMLNVRGRLGAAASDELRSHILCDVVYKYTSEGPQSIYKHVNNTLALKLEGAQPTRGSGVYFYTEKLTMAIRLLFDSSANIARVFRGLSAEGGVDVDFYRQCQRNGKQVQWNSFTSTSLSRDVALNFARDGGVLFTIKRDPTHAAAADIGAFSQFPNEQEVLLLPMQIFDVVGVHVRDTFSEIVLDEVPHYPQEL